MITINQRNYSVHEGSLPYEPINKNFSHLFDVDYLSVISLQGDKSRAFLQGQISCDVTKVTTEQFQHGLFCNLKGRILSLADVFESESLNMIVPSDLSTDLLASLNKVAMLSRVKISINPDLIVLGYFNNADDANPLIQINAQHFGAFTSDDYTSLHVGNNYYLLICTSIYAVQIIKSFNTDNYHGSFKWHSERLKHGEISIYPNSQATFLPHRLGLQKDYLSFDKGCYKGQEVIARTHYRATIKHALKLLTCAFTDKLQPGMRILDIEGQEVGELVDISPILNGYYLIAASMLIEHPYEVRFEGIENIVTLIRT